jgi:hypothetical protein
MGIYRFYGIIFLKNIPWNMAMARTPSPRAPGPPVYGSRLMADGLRLMALCSRLAARA